VKKEREKKKTGKEHSEIAKKEKSMQSWFSRGEHQSVWAYHFLNLIIIGGNLLHIYTVVSIFSRHYISSFFTSSPTLIKINTALYTAEKIRTTCALSFTAFTMDHVKQERTAELSTHGFTTVAKLKAKLKKLGIKLSKKSKLKAELIHILVEHEFVTASNGSIKWTNAFESDNGSDDEHSCTYDPCGDRVFDPCDECGFEGGACECHDCQCGAAAVKHICMIMTVAITRTTRNAVRIAEELTQY